jgi:curli biogenesis system outer membrane secretion channel CsgG
MSADNADMAPGRDSFEKGGFRQGQLDFRHFQGRIGASRTVAKPSRTAAKERQMTPRHPFGGLVLALAISTLCGCQRPVEVQFSPELQHKSNMTVAVLPFEQSEPPPSHAETLWVAMFAKDTGAMLSDTFTTELMRVPGFRVVERSQLKRILAEQDLSLSELLAKKSAQDIGRLLGVDAVVMGTVGDVFTGTTFIPGTGGCHFSYSVRVVDTKTGIVLISTAVTRQIGGDMDVTKHIFASVREVADKIIEKRK